MQFTAETRGVLEMQNFIPSYMKGWAYVRTDGRTDGRFCQNQNVLVA